MALSGEEIIRILEKARELGYVKVTIEGNEFIVGKEKPDTNVPDLKAEDIVKPMPAMEEMTDDEILYWSTPFGLELEARKQKGREDEQNRS